MSVISRGLLGPHATAALHVIIFPIVDDSISFYLFSIKYDIIFF